MHPTNKDIIFVLKSVAACYDLTGASRFRIVAYQKAADAVEHLHQELYDIWQNEQLHTVEGIGPSITEHLEEFFKNPKKNYLTEQMDKLPHTVYVLMKAPGIGPKKAARIVKEFELENVKTVFNDVRKIAEKGEIAKLEGFGEKSEKDIIKAIDLYENASETEERMILPVAQKLAYDVIQYMKRCVEVDIRDDMIDTMGSLRRQMPTIGDVDLVVKVPDTDAKKVISHFVSYPGKVSVEAEGSNKAAIMVSGSRRVDIRTVSPDEYGSMIQYFTGSKQHNIKLRELALKKHKSLSEFGIKNTITGEIAKFKTEEDFYKDIGLDWIPPELREGTDEILHAKNATLPKLVERSDIKGEFHIHSSFDVTTSHDLGNDSIEDMVKEALKLGYSYLAFSEHNPALSTDEARINEIIKRKGEEIVRIQKNYPEIHLFNSLEIDIRPDGTLALPDTAFRYLDLCVISIHSAFRMTRSEMTQRILKAMEHPKVKILGHPTGRQIGKREEIDVDWPRVFDEAKKRTIALEINSWHERLDLPERLVRQAVENGNKLVIDTDSHAKDQMSGISYGVSVARRGWAQKSDILNTQSVNKVLQWIQS